MIDQVKQEIQRYYPSDYLFMEFLRTGGWYVAHQTKFGTRHHVVLDGITFELAHYNEHDDVPEPGIVIRTFYDNPHRISGIPILGPNARVNNLEELTAKVHRVMTGIYHSPRFRGTQYHARI